MYDPIKEGDGVSEVKSVGRYDACWEMGERMGWTKSYSNDYGPLEFSEDPFFLLTGDGMLEVLSWVRGLPGPNEKGAPMYYISICTNEKWEVYITSNYDGGEGYFTEEEAANIPKAVLCAALNATDEEGRKWEIQD